MSNSKPLVHIGMAKAASTFLQNEVFPGVPGVRNLGKHNVTQDLKRGCSSITRRVSIDWDASVHGSATAKEYQLAVENGEKAVLSEEDLSVFKFLDPETMAYRLRQIFGDYDVLFVIREPISWLKSHYLFRLHNFNEVAALGFDHWLDHHLGNARIGSDVLETRYASLASLYGKISGGDISIIPYEILKNDKDAFACLLADVLEQEVEDIRPLVFQPTSKRHKKRITVEKQELFEIYRWVVLQQYDKTYSELRSFADRYSLELPDNVLCDTFSIQDKIKSKKDWQLIFRRIESVLDDEGKPADPLVPSDISEKVLSSTRRQLRSLKTEFGFDLNDYGLDYVR